jgi:hypothetical protein
LETGKTGGRESTAVFQWKICQCFSNCNVLKCTFADVVVHACNPSTQEVDRGESQVQCILGYLEKHPISKNKNLEKVSLSDPDGLRQGSEILTCSQVVLQLQVRGPHSE